MQLIQVKTSLVSLILNVQCRGVTEEASMDMGMAWAAQVACTNQDKLGTSDLEYVMQQKPKEIQ